MAVQTGGWQRRSYRAPPKRLTTSSGPAYRHPRHISPSAFTIPPLFHSPPPKFTSAFYSFVVISHMIRHAILPRPLAAKSRNNCLPSSAVNSRQNAELFHLTAFLSAFSALFFPMGVRQLLLIHALPHSFHRNGGVGRYDRVENSRVSPANYQLSTVDFPALHRPALSAAEGSPATGRRLALSAAEGSLPLITPLEAILTGPSVRMCQQSTYNPFILIFLTDLAPVNPLRAHS